MGNQALIYKEKFSKSLKESKIHLKRIENAFEELDSFSFPLGKKDLKSILNDKVLLAFIDQIIYRFSKVQDCMGAKLFKSFLLYQGENVDKPFLDILNILEKIDLLNVDEWFELREIRNEIAHDYEDNDEICLNIINNIFAHKLRLNKIIEKLELKL